MQVVVVPPPLSLAAYQPVLLQPSQDGEGGPLRYAHRIGDLAEGRAGAPPNVDQDKGVIGEKTPLAHLLVLL
jgi:hypothetical protein